MSWEPSASLDFPVETSTASVSRCSGMLLAASELGKSEGFELSGVASSNCIISSLRNCWRAYCSAMAYILIENFHSVRMAQGKSQMGTFFFFQLGDQFLRYFSQKNLVGIVLKDSFHGFA